ncbi:MAG: hypothetical protein M1831_000485 [Alyxoria varia]|nr:MAG: hypothetical protein M1831_000485 [Alyxoria varia]
MAPADVAAVAAGATAHKLVARFWAGMTTLIGTVVTLGLGSLAVYFVDVHNTKVAKRPPSGKLTAVRLGVGLQKNHGGLIDVRLFNEKRQLLGPPMADFTCSDGNAACEMKIEHDKDKTGQQGTYGLFTANSDGMCIGYVTVTLADNTKWGWLGDWAAIDGRCNMGQSWYYSNIVLQSQGKPYSPKCLWIDGDHVPRSTATAFMVHFPSFLAATLDPGPPLADKSSYEWCGYPKYEVYHHPDLSRPVDPVAGTHWSMDDLSDLAFDLRHYDRSLQRRSEVVNETESIGSNQGQRKITTPENETRLVRSNHTDQSTEYLCNAANSFGPNFMNEHDRQFCDMHSKTLYNFCEGLDSNDCFEADTLRLRTTGKDGLVRRDGIGYSEILDWR